MKIEFKKNINSQCVDFGITVSWNTGFLIEVSFLFWHMDCILWGY